MTTCMRASWSESPVAGTRRRLRLTLNPSVVHSDTQPESQPIDVRTHYTPNISKFLLWEGERLDC